MSKRFAASAVFQRMLMEHKDVSDLLVRKFAVAQKIEPVDDSGDGRLKFIISTASVDREGDIISVDGWKLENYRKNPVVLWCHDYTALPVAKSEEIHVENGQLVSTARFAIELDPFYKLVYELYRGGYMSAVSVGFDPIRWEWVEERPEGKRGVDFKEQELLEYSCVPVPANPDALVQARALGHIDTTPMKGWASERLDGLGEKDAGFKLENGILIPRGLLELLYKTADGQEPPAISMPTILSAEDITDEGQPEAGSDIQNQNGESPAVQPAQTTPEPGGDGGEGAAGYSESEVATSGPSPEVAERSTPRGHGWTDFHHHQRDADGKERAVVWRGVTHAMEALLDGRLDDASGQKYRHLAEHYRNDFDTEPPELRFVETHVLKHFPDLFVFDSDSGILSVLSGADRAKAAVETQIGRLREAIESSKALLPEGYADKAFAALSALKEWNSPAVQRADAGNGGKDNGNSATGCATISEVNEFLKTEAPGLIRDAMASELGRLRGRVD